MLYCYYCGGWYGLEESVAGNLCECKGGYLFSVDVEQESDLDIDISEVI